MKRTLFIVIGILIILLLIGVWAYVFFTDTTSDSVSFNDFGFGDTTDPTAVIPEQPVEEESTVSEPTERLRQLTTKNVIGYTEVQQPDEVTQVVYAEAGTGHIHQLNLDTNEEVRVSATTIPLASKAAITPNGQHVLMQSDQGTNASFIIGNLSSSSDRLSNFTLDEPIIDFTATTDNELLYAVAAGNDVDVKAYDPSNNQTRTLFTIPFRAVAIAWHHTTAGPHVVYPQTTRELEGFVYQYTNGQVERVNATGYGLAAVGSTDGILYSQQNQGEYQSMVMPSSAIVAESTPITFIPEKCHFLATVTDQAICGSSLDEFSRPMPDSWYQGVVSLNDSLWRYSVNTNSATLLVDPESTAGRQVDLINPSFGASDANFYFQNKIDNTLWVYHYIVSS